MPSISTNAHENISEQKIWTIKIWVIHTLNERYIWTFWNNLGAYLIILLFLKKKEKKDNCLLRDIPLNNVEKKQKNKNDFVHKTIIDFQSTRAKKKRNIFVFSFLRKFLKMKQKRWCSHFCSIIIQRKYLLPFSCFLHFKSMSN